MTIYTKSQCIEPFLEILVEFTSCVDFEIGVIFKLEAEANKIIGSLSYRLLSFNSYDGWLFHIDWIFNPFFTSKFTCKKYYEKYSPNHQSWSIVRQFFHG